MFSLVASKAEQRVPLVAVVMELVMDIDLVGMMVEMMVVELVACSVVLWVVDLDFETAEEMGD